MSAKRVGGIKVLQRLAGRAKQTFYPPSPKRFRRITKKICEGFHRTLLRFQSDFNDFNRISEDFSRISEDFNQMLKISVEFQGFQHDFKDFVDFSRISAGFYGGLYTGFQ